MTPEESVLLGRQALAQYNGAPAAVPNIPLTQDIPMSAPAAEVIAPPMAPTAPQTTLDSPAPAPLPPASALPPPVVTNSRAAMAEMDQAAMAQEQAVLQEAEAKTAGLEDKSETAQVQIAMEREALEKVAERAQAWQAEREKIKSDYQTLNAQAENVQIKDRRTTGQRVLGTIALALGSVADGFARMGGNNDTNHANTISQQLEAQIDNDMKLQREALNDKRKAASEKLTELGLARSFFNDDQQAEEFARASRKELYARELEAAGARSQIPAIKAAAVGAAANFRGQSAEKKAQLLTSSENARQMAAAANARLQTTEQMKPGNTPLTVLEALEKENRLTADQAQELETVRRQIKDRQNEGKETEGQAKARSLFEGSKNDADRITAAMQGNKLPSGSTVRAAESPLVPDAVIPEEAQVYRSARALVNDVLRDESGASIGDKEKEELLAPLKSSDPEIVKQGYERILAKRAAMGSKAPKANKQERWPGAPAPSDDMVEVELNGRRGRIPAGNFDAFLKANPEAKRL